MPKIKIIYILIAVILAGLLVYVGYFFGQRGKEVSGPGEKPEITTPEELGAGEVGEIMVKDEKTGEESPLISPTMPLAIFSTLGTVIEVKSDRIILKSDGYSFADRVPRTITAILAAETITLNKNQTFRWIGLSGLKQFKVGMEILISSQENIRGKTEFQIKTINML